MILTSHSDALRRHEQVHAEPKRSSLGRGSRACLACASGRRKCSGGQPCSGCHSRSIECKYPESGRHGGETLPIRHAESPSIPGEDQGMMNSDDSAIPWANTSGSPTAERGQSSQFTPHQLTGNFGEQEPALSYGTPAPFPTLYSQHDIEMQPNISPGPSGPGSHSLPPMSLSPSNISVRRAAYETDIIPDSSQDIMETTDPALHAMSSGRDLQDAEAFSRNWYQNGFTSINWLPENWTPDFSMEDRDDVGAANHQQYPALGTAIENSVTHSALNMPATRGQSHRQRVPSIAASQLVDAQSNSSPGSQSTHSAGQYYVDGEGARLPRVRKAPYRVADPIIPLSLSDNQHLYRGFMFPNIDKAQEASTIPATDELPLTIYNEILRIFGLTCITSTHYTPFQSSSFPSPKFLGRSIRMYIAHFQPVLPFMHPATFNFSTSHLLLVLAVASIGSHYIEFEETGLLTIAMHEFTRRAIQFMVSLWPREVLMTVILLEKSDVLKYFPYLGRIQ